MISVIIPTFNRANILERTLISIKDQNTDVKFEVIVVDNGSNDHTKQICDKYAKFITDFHYLFDDTPGLLTGRHLGAQHAKANILCFLDDDVSLDSNYINCVYLNFENDPSIQLATGPCLPEYETNPPEWLPYFWTQDKNGKYCSWLSLLDFGDKIIEIDPNFVWGLNFCIRKQALVDLGGFHPDCIPDHLQQFQGDGETGLTIKAREKGFKAVYIPSLKLKHYVSGGRLTKPYFQKRAYYQGVCNSFTALRTNAKTSMKPTESIFKKIRNYIHPLYRWIKPLFIQSKEEKIPNEIKLFFETLRKEELRGFEFHQQQFNANEKVRNWVLRDNYWDYKLP
ncbi:glycosyltransferase family 2 protein [Pedobacter flavus]|uniref:Glycosyltransferase family 2 protein n=1 Tax=Pedobacter flavus TaxID=3113906 RepID=A0ABU7GY22_9SPHI|nr:glycosyltransferase family 2 protein [Pedobacter sp. VNH31]MEE1883911.1 glycosyltransferase family 2 protein [Pedobacter sp. VNH31]